MGLYEDLFDFDGDGKVTLDDELMWDELEWRQRNQNNGSGGCYIATCVYGSYDCPQVWTLRRFRDEQLACSVFGRLFIKIYYAVSPTAVKLFGNTAWFRRFWKGRLDGLVAKLNSRGVLDTPYQDARW